MTHDAPPVEVLYEDNHLLGVVKPAGLLCQGDRTGDVTLFELAKAYIKSAYGKPGDVYLGLVHRLDRPVSGVMVFARTSKAASRLTNAFRERRVEKRYLAVVHGSPAQDSGRIEGLIERSHLRSRLASVPSPQARDAILTYRVLQRADGMTLLEVVPQTGRHHQIRVQLSGEGLVVAGDLKYGDRAPLADKSIALHACRLVIPHPTKSESVAMTCAPPAVVPWPTFQDATDRYCS